MTFKIKEARQLAGITQKELAKTIGVSAGTLSDYENGNHDPKSDCLARIADACNVTVDFLLGRETKKSPTPPEGSAGENGKLSVDEVEKVLLSLGLIQEGQDVTEDDLRFINSVLDLIDMWFQNRHQKG